MNQLFMIDSIQHTQTHTRSHFLRYQKKILNQHEYKDLIRFLKRFIIFFIFYLSLTNIRPLAFNLGFRFFFFSSLLNLQPYLFQCLSFMNADTHTKTPTQIQPTHSQQKNDLIPHLLPSYSLHSGAAGPRVRSPETARARPF